MPGYYKKLLATASVIVTTGAVAFGGLAAASASTTARPNVTGIEHFQIMTTSATSNQASFIARGVFTTGGVDIQGNTTDLVKVPGGTFKIRHSQGHGSQTFNPRTCLLSLNLHGTYRLRHGTGRFAGIRGHGRYQLRILAIGARNANGKCSQRKPPVTFQQVIVAKGPVHR
jgi:hypothetical protein